MTKQECAIIMTHTGVCMLTGDDFSIFHKYCEDLLGRPIYTHQFPELADELKERSKNDFLRLCRESVDTSKPPKSASDAKWVSVYDELPPEDTTILVTYTINDKKRRYVGTGYRIGNTIDIDGKEYFVKHVDIHVIAWQPMPKAYKGE